MSRVEYDPSGSTEQDDAGESPEVRQRRDQECEDWKWLGANKQGRRIVAKLLEIAHVSRTSFVAPNAMTVAYMEGERNVGLYVQAQVLRNCPARYLEMLKECQENARSAKPAR